MVIVTEDGGYESASDYDEETLALITREEHGGDDSDHESNTWLLKTLTGINV